MKQTRNGQVCLGVIDFALQEYDSVLVQQLFAGEGTSKALVFAQGTARRGD
jgi:hypothetical protein